MPFPLISVIVPAYNRAYCLRALPEVGMIWTDMEAPEDVRNSALWSGDLFTLLILGELVHTSTVLMTRERLERVGGFRPDLESSGADYDFHLRIAREGTVAFLDAPTLRCQIGMSDALSQPGYNIYRALNHLKALWSNPGAPEVWKSLVMSGLPAFMRRRRLAA